MLIPRVLFMSPSRTRIASVATFSLHLIVRHRIVHRIPVTMTDVLTVTLVGLTGLDHLTAGLVAGGTSLDLFGFRVVLALCFCARHLIYRYSPGPGVVGGS